MSYRIIVVVSIMSISLSCAAMNVDGKKLERIWFVGFPTNGMVAVGGNKGCKIYSPQRQLITSLSEGNDICNMVFSSDGKKMALVLREAIDFYDILSNQEVKKIHSEKWLATQIALGNENLLIYPSYSGAGKNWLVHFYNYETQVDKAHSIGNFNVSVPISCHPTKNEVVVANHKYCVSTINFDGVFRQLYCGNDHILSVEYNFDGSMVVVNDRRNGYSFFKETDDAKKPSITICDALKSKAGQCYLAIAFHPNNIIAALLRHDSNIEFWDYKNTKLLHTIALNIIETTKLEGAGNYAKKLLAFSPDGGQFVAASKNNLFIGGTFFDTIGDVICKLGTKESCINSILLFSFFNLPKDIQCIIIEKFISLCKLDSDITLLKNKDSALNKPEVTVTDSSIGRQGWWRSLSLFKQRVIYTISAATLAGIMAAVYYKLAR